MIIAIPVNDQSAGDTVCISFGRAPCFLLYDTESGDKSMVSNNAAASQGGAGIKAAQAVVDSRAEVLLTPRCGDNAAGIFKAAGIKIYKTLNNSTKDNINAFTAGKLSLLDDYNSGDDAQGG